MWLCFRKQMKNADLWRQAQYPHGHRDVTLSFPHCGSIGHASQLAVKTSESGWWDLTVNLIVVICLFCTSGWEITGWKIPLKGRWESLPSHEWLPLDKGRVCVISPCHGVTLASVYTHSSGIWVSIISQGITCRSRAKSRSNCLTVFQCLILLISISLEIFQEFIGDLMTFSGIHKG